MPLPKSMPASWSQPTRAAWIEIFNKKILLDNQNRSQPTRAAWIEMFSTTRIFRLVNRRSPLGLRGLKSNGCTAATAAFTSQPTRAAWIEMFSNCCSMWFGISRSPLGLRGLKSTVYDTSSDGKRVAAHSGCVD